MTAGWKPPTTARRFASNLARITPWSGCGERAPRPDELGHGFPPGEQLRVTESQTPRLLARVLVGR
jgi:hypothetical protein